MQVILLLLLILLLLSHGTSFRLQMSQKTFEFPDLQKINFPIIQLIKKNEIVGEFFGTEPISETVSKLQSSLQTHSKDIDNFRIFSNIRNIYSDSQLLHNFNEEKSLLLLKISKSGCAKCVEIDASSEFQRLITSTSTQVLQTDSSYIPEYMALLSSRLSGKLNNDGINCAECRNSGFTSCLTCDGKGFMKNGNLALFCPTCNGSKKIRCSSCGGKCLIC